MWKIEREEYYFKIYDDKQNLTGYFAPEYGEIYPEEKSEEVIEQMHKNHDKIKGGYLMIPMMKFGIFSENREMNIDYLERQLNEVKTRLSYWRDFISNNGVQRYKIMVSHTDNDMLSITFELIFSTPIKLEKKDLQTEIGKTLDSLQGIGLL